MYGKGTSLGESKEACRLEYEDVLWGREGRSEGEGGKGREGPAEESRIDQ